MHQKTGERHIRQYKDKHKAVIFKLKKKLHILNDVLNIKISYF